MLLVAHLGLVASLHVYLLEGVEGVARFLHLTIDDSDFVFDLLALCLVCLICQAALVYLVAVVDYLGVELHHDCRHVLERFLELLAVELIVADHIAVIAKQGHLQILLIRNTFSWSGNTDKTKGKVSTKSM